MHVQASVQTHPCQALQDSVKVAGSPPASDQCRGLGDGALAGREMPSDGQHWQGQPCLQPPRAPSPERLQETEASGSSPKWCILGVGPPPQAEMHGARARGPYSHPHAHTRAPICSLLPSTRIRACINAASGLHTQTACMSLSCTHTANRHPGGAKGARTDLLTLHMPGARRCHSMHQDPASHPRCTHPRHNLLCPCVCEACPKRHALAWHARVCMPMGTHALCC